MWPSFCLSFLNCRGYRHTMQTQPLDWAGIEPMSLKRSQPAEQCLSITPSWDHKLQVLTQKIYVQHLFRTVKVKNAELPPQIAKVVAPSLILLSCILYIFYMPINLPMYSLLSFKTLTSCKYCHSLVFLIFPLPKKFPGVHCQSLSILSVLGNQ